MGHDVETALALPVYAESQGAAVQIIALVLLQSYVVLHDVADGAKVAGNPARMLLTE